MASVMNAPEWPRRVGGINPETPDSVSTGCSASAADVDPSPGPGTGRRYSGSSRGVMSLPRAVGEVVRARIHGIVDRLDDALGIPEPIADLRLRHRPALLARAHDDQCRRSVDPDALRDARVPGDVLGARDEHRDVGVSGEGLDRASDQAIVDPSSADDQQSDCVAALPRLDDGSREARAGDQRLGRDGPAGDRWARGAGRAGGAPTGGSDRGGGPARLRARGRRCWRRGARALLAHVRHEEETDDQDQRSDHPDLNLRVVVDGLPHPTTCSIPLALWPLAESISLKSCGLEAVSIATSSETTPSVT